MIVGGGTRIGLFPRAAALALALGGALSVAFSAPASASAARIDATPIDATPIDAALIDAGAARAGDWVPAWSWRSGSGGLPKGCAPYSGRTSAGMRWSASLVRVVQGRLRLAAAAGTTRHDPAGSGVGCADRAELYGRLEVRARMPQGPGVVARIALWPSIASRGSDWSGLTVPSPDVGPAYATNGCGDEAYGAALPAPLADRFHDYLITWSPRGFSVAVDGRTLYRDGKSFARPRWLGISLSTAGPAAGSAKLLVEKVVAFRWTGPEAAATGTAAGNAPAPGSQDSPDAVSSVQQTAAPAVSGGRAGTVAGGGTMGGPRRPAPGTAAVAAGNDAAVTSALEGTPLGAPWLIGGACVAVGVLVGVVRAARLSRRARPTSAAAPRGPGRTTAAPGPGAAP